MMKALRNICHHIARPTTAILALLLLQGPILFGFVRLSKIVCNLPYNINSVESPSAAKSQKTNVIESSLHQAGCVTASAIGTSSWNTKQPKPKYQLRPHGHAHYPFVQFSAYRVSTRVFFVVGITSVVARNFDLPAYKCEWRPDTSGNELVPQPSKVTDANLIYVYFDQMPRTYVVATVNCTFDDDVGVGEEGGSLFMTVSVGPHPGDTEKVMVLQENETETKAMMGIRDQSISLKYAFCSPPMHGDIRGDWLLHWLIYHLYIWRGSVHFFFYNVGGITDNIRHILNPFVDKGILTILDVEDEKEYPSWYFNQLLFINDCLHRTRHLSSWTFFHDFDEFLSIASPSTLDKLLDENQDAPYISFGSLRASLWLCAEDAQYDSRTLERYWPLQRMLWFEKKPYCDDANQDPWLCVGGVGARKYVVNPRKVFAAGVHKTAIPDRGGVDLHTSIARLNHYRGLASTKTTYCSFSVNTSMTLSELHHNIPSTQQYMRDDQMSIEAGKARNFSSEFLAAVVV